MITDVMTLFKNGRNEAAVYLGILSRDKENGLHGMPFQQLQKRPRCRRIRPVIERHRYDGPSRISPVYDREKEALRVTERGHQTKQDKDGQGYGCPLKLKYRKYQGKHES